MNTMQLACFLAVAETLSFARAAEQLHVTQPAVTQQIHSLESELNTQLFRRTTRTVELTQAGLIFLGDAKLMLEISERARLRAEHAVEDLRQPFVIGLPRRRGRVPPRGAPAPHGRALSACMQHCP